MYAFCWSWEVYLLLSEDLSGDLGSWASELGLEVKQSALLILRPLHLGQNYTTGFLGFLAGRWQVLGLPDFHNHEPIPASS